VSFTGCSEVMRAFGSSALLLCCRLCSGRKCVELECCRQWTPANCYIGHTPRDGNPDDEQNVKTQVFPKKFTPKSGILKTEPDDLFASRRHFVVFSSLRSFEYEMRITGYA
jgi:hypothetical protein